MNCRYKHGILWIGFGNFARRLYPHVARRPNVEIASFYYPDKTEALKRFGARASWDIERAVSDSSVTTIFITTPNDRHTEYLRLALASGRHIFVEKPVTALIGEAVELLPLAEKSRAVLMVGHNKRRQAAIREMKKMMDAGAVGKVVSIYANNSKGIAYSIDETDWRFQEKRHREGPLITVGIHLVEVMHYLLGPVESVSATIKNISHKTEAPDSNAVLLNFSSGASAFLEANYNMPSEDMLNIYGTDGTLYADRGQLRYRSGRDRNRVPSIAVAVPLEPVDTLAEEINEFFDAIEGRSRVETGFQEALNALAVIEACFQSSRDHRCIEIKSVTEEYFKNESA